jgi:hypothetical protein
MTPRSRFRQHVYPENANQNGPAARQKIAHLTAAPASLAGGVCLEICSNAATSNSSWQNSQTPRY